MRTLMQLTYNEQTYIRSVHAPEDIQQMLLELGLRENIAVTAKNKAPFGGPAIFLIGTQEVALGKELAQQIEVQ